MDVNGSAGIGKEFGLPAVPAIEREGREKARTRPVEQSGQSDRAALDEKRRQAREDQARATLLSNEEVGKAVEEIQERLDSMGTKLQLSLDSNTESIVIQVKDRNSGELVRQIPTEEMLALKAKLKDLLGVLFDQEV